MNQLSLYGIEQIIRKYTGYPPFLPLVCLFEHGWTNMSEANKVELSMANHLMLVFCKRRAEAWREKSNIPVVIMGAPLVLYRKMKNIEKLADVKGTVAFPAHGTEDIDATFNIDEYCRQLKNLPPEYHPITICLHCDDMNRKKDIPYLKYGFEVVSAGAKYVNDFSFADKFYHILGRHKYATSNQVGTYSFLAVEMGIPFFILGEPAVIINYGTNIIRPPKYTINDFPMGRMAMRIFSSPPGIITQEQTDFVNSELGINDCLSKSQLRKHLLIAYLRHLRASIEPILVNWPSLLIEFVRKVYLKTPLVPYVWRGIKKLLFVSKFK